MVVQGISVFDGRPVEVTVDGGVIDRIDPLSGTGTSAGDLPLLSPGFLDMQVNGYAGLDYSDERLEAVHVERIADALAASGTTQHVPTIITSPEALILRNLRTIASAVRTARRVGTAVPGIHVEGPFISSEDGPRGAHNATFVRGPDLAELRRWRDAAEGLLLVVTVAPERPGALELISRAAEAGLLVAIGHSGARPEVIRDAVAAGARLSTHLGNGSYTELPRLENYIWEQLASDELTAGLIPDGFHLPGSVVKVFTRAKGMSRIVLVSDVSPLAGSPVGINSWMGQEVEVFADGHLGLPGTSILAGAGHLLDWGLAHFVRFTGRPLSEAVRLCTENPARLLGLPREYGRLEPGAPANLCLFRFEPGDDRLRVERTVCRGEEVAHAG